MPNFSSVRFPGASGLNRSRRRQCELRSVSWSIRSEEHPSLPTLVSCGFLAHAIRTASIAANLNNVQFLDHPIRRASVAATLAGHSGAPKPVNRPPVAEALRCLLQRLEHYAALAVRCQPTSTPRFLAALNGSAPGRLQKRTSRHS